MTRHTGACVSGICLFLVTIIWIVFGQTLHHDFINFDDDAYVYENSMVQGGLTAKGVVWAFTHVQASNWHPLTTLSHMVDCQFYGLNPGGHHLTNLLLHCLTAILLFFVLSQMTDTIWPAAFVAAVFAIHPLRVESVAWISERKDVLSGLFFVLTLGAYVRYARRPWSFFRYLPVPLFFALGLMSKPMLVTLPLVLFLLDYWPLKRLAPVGKIKFFVWQRLVIEKIPLLLMSVAAGVATVWVQGNAIHAAQTVPLLLRVGNVPISYVVYLRQLFCPVNLAVFYPYPPAGYPAAEIILSTLFLVAITVIAFRCRQKHPYLLFGWAWYLVMLLPVIGLVQAGSQAHADRYAYLPEIGVCCALTWWVLALSVSWHHRCMALGFVAAAIILVLVPVAYTQTAYWHDSESLWNHTLACTTNNALAESNLANDLFQQGRLDEAITHAEAAIAIQPDYPDAENCLGMALLQTGRLDEAMSHFQSALKMNPDFASAHNNYGMALFQNGRLDEAIPQFQAALEAQPDMADAHNNLGAALVQKGQPQPAIDHYQIALELKPDYIGAENNLAWLLATSTNSGLRDGPKAVQLAQRANQLANSNNLVVLRTLAAAYAETGQFSEAIAIAGQARQLAAAKGNTVWADGLQAEIQLYQTGQPFRDNGQTP
jgi:protein O-mannosyl-transferase